MKQNGPKTEPSFQRRRGRPRADAEAPRDRLIEAAFKLFNREGFQAVGIDRVLSEAGVAKMTLYGHFASKDELILAVLAKRKGELLAWLRGQSVLREGEPRQRLLVFFDVLGDWFDQPQFHGCLFARAAAEYPDHDSAPHQQAEDYKRQLLVLLSDFAGQAGAASPRLLAQRLLLLVEGAIVLAQVLGGRESARQARDTAALILRQMLP